MRGYSEFMNDHPKPPEQDELRDKIMDAAEERFAHFGYGKTTMAEIAQDCACSAANLYRYFESKQDIAAEVSRRCMQKRVQAMREVVRRPGVAASERLRAYVLETLTQSREYKDDRPKINELIALIMEQRVALVHEKMHAQQALITEILAYGNETGEFDVDDVLTTARSVYASLTLFEVPIFQPLFGEREFVDLANNVVDLLLRGLVKR